jgi:hypothetical protein
MIMQEQVILITIGLRDNATCGQAINELNDAIIVSAQPDEPPQVSLVFVDVKASPELAKTYQVI